MRRPPELVHRLDVDLLEQHLDDLCDVLIDSVAAGASISFLSPLTRDEARRFWRVDVGEAVRLDHTRLFGTLDHDRLTGTVQLVTALPPNQPHRAEISKMIVHPDARGRGLARALTTVALDEARLAGKTLVTLDTRTGDVSEDLYRGLGFEVAGIIPDYALDPDGATLHSTTLMFKRL